ncbi:MAG: hypothetical protein K6G06_07660 [Butyrivibrio sp.]|nr:hypothetical protein [Butyrivibrio sp.]
MKIQCDFCGNTYEDTLKECPDCGAPNQSHYDGDVRPRTIAELKSWYQARQLPPENVTRFFIGKDVREPKAFGIYQDANGDFIVYKNKADGTRAVRYQGDDEQYAVHELYQKLKDEIVHQKSLKLSREEEAQIKEESQKYLQRTIRKANRTSFIGVILGLILVVALNLYTNHAVSHVGEFNGYYSYDNEVYYNDSNDWFRYDDQYDSWYQVSEPAQYDEKNRDPYFMGKNYSDAKAWEFADNEFSDVTQSASYQENAESRASRSESNSWDNDSDYDWDGGSDWDSDSTDWDSDW